MHAHLTTCRLLLVQPLWPHELAAGADALKECVTTCVSYVALFKVVSSIVMHAPLQNTGTLSTSTAARLRQAGLWRERGFRPPREALPSVLSCTSRWPQSGGARSPCARGRSIDIPEHYRHSRASAEGGAVPGRRRRPPCVDGDWVSPVDAVIRFSCREIGIAHEHSPVISLKKRSRSRSVRRNIV